ncbi:MAG: hypothetical protein WAK55_19755, partial [Xanthobacteraceae bacterium]
EIQAAVTLIATTIVALIEIILAGSSLRWQRSTKQAGLPPLGRASIMDSYWPDLGVFAMLYSFSLPLLAI